MDAPPERTGGLALVETDLVAGSLVLEGKEGPVTLLWRGGEESRVRGLEPGAWRLRGARVERMEGKEHWFLSSTGPPGPPVDLPAGKATRFEVGDEVRFEGHAARKGKGLHLGFSLRDAAGRGVSVYREDRRVEVAWRALDGKGGVLAEGPMTYG